MLIVLVKDDPTRFGDSGEVPMSDWSGWQFDSHCEIFSLLYGINKYITLFIKILF